MYFKYRFLFLTLCYWITVSSSYYFKKINTAIYHWQIRGSLIFATPGNGLSKCIIMNSYKRINKKPLFGLQLIPVNFLTNAFSNWTLASSLNIYRKCFDYIPVYSLFSIDHNFGRTTSYLDFLLSVPKANIAIRQHSVNSFQSHTQNMIVIYGNW